MTSKVGRSGVFDSPDAGQRLEFARRRRKWVILGGLIVVGFAGGFISGFTQADNLFTGATAWPPALSIGLALAYLGAVIGGGIAIGRQSDEFELQTQYKAVAVAAAAYLLVYPPWFLLWMANLVREPIHCVLFLIFWGVLALASLFYRFR